MVGSEEMYEQGSDERAGRRQRAIEAYDGAGDRIGEAPLIALGAGFAVGALVAALLPRSRRETELLQPVVGRVRDSARQAAEAAKEAGSDRLRELGLTPDAGRDVVKRVMDGLADVARSSSQAAVGRVRGE